MRVRWTAWSAIAVIGCAGAAHAQFERRPAESRPAESRPGESRPGERTWSGMVANSRLQRSAPESGFIADAQAWKRLWSLWRPREQPPSIDFDKHVVLVGVVPGPNLVRLQVKRDRQGALTFVTSGAKVAGPGFGYQLLQIPREGVRSINGTRLGGSARGAPGEDDRGDVIRVEVIGTLRTGRFAIGGETTGTTITAKGITWELNLGDDSRMQRDARRLHDRKVRVEGSLEKRRGVEIRERWIVNVTRLAAARR